MNKNIILGIIFLFLLTISLIFWSTFIFPEKFSFIQDLNIPFLKKNNSAEKNINTPENKISEKTETNINKYENIKIDIATSTPDTTNNATTTVTDNMDTLNIQASSTNEDVNKVDISSYMIFEDSDGDMLYDYEEAIVYGTNYLNKDSDEDGYSDKEEIDGGFNPRGEGILATNSPEYLLKKIEIARHGCDLSQINNKVNYLTNEELSASTSESVTEKTKEFVKNINDKTNEWLNTKIPTNKIDKITFTKKEIISPEKIKLEYRIFYKNEEKDIFIDNALYFININEEWMLDNYLNTLNSMTLETEEMNTSQEKIITDIKEIQSALNIYYLNHEKYPQSIYPDIATGTTIYLSTPLNRTKTIACIESSKYTYKAISSSTDYTLNYCLEKDIKNIPAGINTAKPNILSTRERFNVIYKNCASEETNTNTTNMNESQNTTSSTTKENTEENNKIKNENLDTDNDGVSNLDELFYKTDPENPDTDEDGYTDGEEIKNGYNPIGEGLLI